MRDVVVVLKIQTRCSPKILFLIKDPCFSTKINIYKFTHPLPRKKYLNVFYLFYCRKADVVRVLLKRQRYLMELNESVRYISLYPYIIRHHNKGIANRY